MNAARDAVDRLGAAFLAADTDAVLTEFVASDTVVYAGSEAGEVAVGPAGLRLLLEELWSRDERYSWRTVEVVEVSDDEQLYLVADAELTVHVPGTPGGDVVGGWRPAERLPYRVSGVLEHTADGWRWRLCTGSEPSAA